MAKWLQELLLLSVGALILFGVFAALHFAAEEPVRKVRWEAYAAASMIGAVVGFSVHRVAASQAAAVAELERRVAALEGGRTGNMAPGGDKPAGI